jgi:hypothetical protein
MSRTLVLRRVARREFDEATDWYDRQRAGLGADFIGEVNRVFEDIQNQPELHAVVHTSRDPSIWQSRA